MSNVHTVEDVDLGEQEEHEWGEGQVLGDLFDEDTTFDFPRSDVFEMEAQIGTPRFGDGDFDTWATEDVSKR